MEKKTFELGMRPWLFLAMSPFLVLYWIGAGLMYFHAWIRTKSDDLYQG